MLSSTNQKTCCVNSTYWNPHLEFIYISYKFDKDISFFTMKKIFFTDVTVTNAITISILIVAIIVFFIDTSTYAFVGSINSSSNGNGNNQTSPSSSSMSLSRNQQKRNDITTTIMVRAASSSNKTLYLFTAEHDGVNEAKLGIPPDTFSPDVLEVNTGDNVTVHFYNLDTTDSHTLQLEHHTT